MPTTSPTFAPLTVDGLDEVHRLAGMLLGVLPGAGIVVVDSQMRIQLIEGQPHGRHGMTAEAAVGRSISDVLPARAWRAVGAKWSAALSGETVALDWASLDGTAEYLLHFSPLCTSAGEVAGAAMVAQDIGERRQAFRRLERQVGQQAAIATLGSAALHGMAVEDLMQDAARIVEETLGSDAAAVLPYSEAGGLEVRGASGETQLPQPNARAPAGPNEIMNFMRQTDEPLLVDDLGASVLSARILEAEGMVSLAVAPIGPVDDRYGLLGACSRTAGAFAQEDLVFLQAMANILAEARRRERAASEALRREAQLNEAQRLAGLGSWEIDLFTSEHTLSDHLLDMLGLDAQPTGAEAIFARVHVDDRDALRRHIADSVSQAFVEPIEFRIMGPDRSVRLLYGQGTGERDAEGRTLKLRGTVQDVTEQRGAAQALSRSEERFRKGFEASPIGMTLIAPGSGRFLRVNAAYCRFVGRSAEELLTMTYFDVVHPDDLTAPGRAEFGDGQADELVTEARYVRPDGSTVWGSINAARVLNPDDSVDVLFSQVEDVTDRHEREQAMRDELGEVAWVQEVHAALAEDRFELYAQPIVDLATGEVVQHELLLRLHSQTGELIAPGEFLPAAERYGVIREIDRWVIARGTELAAAGMCVEINISGTSMGDATLIEEIDRALQRTGADPSRLVFEITETAVIEGVENARRLAQRLRERGCRFALDDFGTGFAGLSSLKTLPLDYLKIDREFVEDLRTSETDRQVVMASIGLAGAFGLQTIAEGVEDQETLDLLRELGVDYAQGFFLGRPAPISMLDRLKSDLDAAPE
jgi:PAS domain S-box-containing protein